MKKRNEFEFFLEESNHVNEPKIQTFIVEKAEVLFIGKELRIEDNKVSYYLLPFEDNSALVILKLSDDEPFDTLFDNINEYNIEGVINAWPLLINAFQNGVNDNYFAPSLIQPCDLFWGICLMAENISFEDLESEYIMGKVESLVSYTIEMLNQMAENDISTWDKIKNHGKAAADGFKWARTLTHLLSLGGSLLGFSDCGDS